jgi:hypothetical protein
MKVLISENQYKHLVVESTNSKITNQLEKMKSFTKDLSIKSKKQLGFDLKFLLTWGATIGGLMSPVSDFISGEYPELSDKDLTLLITGCVLTYFTDNKEKLKIVLDKIKEEGLVKVFDSMILKVDELKNTFLSFIDSLSVTTHSLSNMLAYSFLIPILPQLYDMSVSGVDSNDISEITKRIVLFFGSTVSGLTIKELISKIVDKFKTNHQ